LYSIFWKYIFPPSSGWHAGILLCLLLHMMMETTCISVTSVDFRWNTRCYISHDRTLHCHRCSFHFISLGTPQRSLMKIHSLHFFSARTSKYKWPALR
jgi:hypothetical protein